MTHKDKDKLCNGLTAGVLSTAIFHPIDVLRIRYFYQHEHLGNFRSFWNGISFNLYSGALKNMFSFSIRDIVRENIPSKYGDLEANLITGTILGSISVPLNAIKTPLQYSQESQNTLGVIRSIYRDRGLSGFYRGGSGLFMRDFLWTLSYFSAFEKINNYTDHRLWSSILAGMISVCFSYPFDGIRLYRQHLHNYNSWHGLCESFRLNHSNFKSFSLAIIRVPAAISLTHMTYLYLNERK